MAAFAGASSAANLVFPTVPLFIAASADPNFMLMIDSSGSMTNIVADDPFNEANSYLDNPATAGVETCTGSNLVPTTQAVDLILPNASVAANTAPSFNGVRPTGQLPVIRFGTSTSNFFWGTTGTNAKCFDPAATYDAARLSADSGTGTNTFEPSGYLGAKYKGNFLNWYFNPQSVTGVLWNSKQRTKPIQTTPSQVLAMSRIEVARAAAVNLVRTLDSRLRVGLSTYNGNDGGNLREGVLPLSVAANRTTLETRINAITPGGNTPLAETLADIGAYFAKGAPSGTTLRLRPNAANASSCGTTGTASCVQTVSAVFTDPGIAASDSNPGLANSSSAAAPVVLSCQKNFAAILTDGKATVDLGISSHLADYDQDCIGNSNCRTHDRKLPISNYIGTEAAPSGSDYLDDVAQALYEMDLRPDFGVEADGRQFVNNVTSYFIGFADEDARTDPLFPQAAAQGSGGRNGVYDAANAAGLQAAFSNIAESVLATIGSASNASTSSSRLDTGSRLYQASFNSGDWSGSFKSLRISAGTGLTCGAVAAGQICPTQDWDAGQLLTAKLPSNRMIYTYSSDTRVGTTFNWANLGTTQQAALNINPASGLADTAGTNRLNYLRGVRSNEGSGTGQFRARSSVLGDIVNSDPALVSVPRFNYSFSGYGDFRATNRTRTPVIYVGANDGMLHGFNANTGDEVLAYVPGSAYGSTTAPTLARLTQTPYTHQFVVDGSPQYGDVQLGTANTWASVLVGTMRSGGKGVFALNVTNPTNFTTSNVSYNASTAPNGVVMWEFTDADDPSLGLTYSQPSIVKMRNGKWAAIFGNGYNSTATGGDANKAALFIVYMDGPTGANRTWVRNTDYFKIVVNSAASVAVPGVLAAAVPNGLASPTPIDINGDRLVDFIYAGDLNGNLWRFDVDSTTTSNWTVGYSGSPVYVAADAATLGNRQPITGRVEVGSNLNSADVDDVTVYFGTGKYLESTDNTQGGQPNQTFYAIHDVIYSNDAATTKSTTPQASNRGNLLKQDILRQVGTGSGATAQTFRVTSNNTYNVTTPEKGWYIDLFNKNNVPTATGGAGVNLGERSVSAPLLSAGRVLFSTQIPPASPCSGGGSGFLMTLDAKNGQRLVTPPFDTNNDGTVNDTDTVSTTLGSDTTATNYGTSGVQSRVGIIDKPVLFSISATEDILYLTGTGKPGETPTQGCGGTLECTKTPATDRRGRITWRELIK